VTSGEGGGFPTEAVPGSGTPPEADRLIRSILAEPVVDVPVPERRARRRHRVGGGLLADRNAGTSPWGPRALVAVAVIWGLVVLRTERLPVASPNDSSVHSLTIAWATHQIAAGHFPLDGWFPYLSLGSPFFLHYQSFSAVVAGLVGNVITAPQAFSWSLYLGLSIWPVSVYLGCRLFDLDRWTAACAAACAPVITNGPVGYGFEHEAYIFYGSGLWSQLWGMLLLPIALGLAWRAISRNERLVAAGVALGGVIILHFLTAYFAGLAVFVFAFLRPTRLVSRVRRLVITGGVALLTACWVLVPLIATAKWAATNEFEEHTYFDDSYGAKQVLSWLFHGQILDSGHFPVISILAAVGFLTCVLRLRRDERARALIAAFVLSLCLYFGRVTWGSLVNILPDSSDLLFHRYVMGVQLFGVVFAGIGASTLMRVVVRILPGLPERLRNAIPGREFLVAATAVVVFVAVLEPAWRAVGAYDAFSAIAIQNQRLADATAGTQVNTLIARAESEGGGRIFAGLPSDGWAYDFRVGSVPVYIYLADRGVDAVGFTLRTSSLTTDPEAYFDESAEGDYELFGIHYLIYPSYKTPSVPATLLERQGEYELYAIDTFGLVHIVDTSGSIDANGNDLGLATASYLGNDLADRDIYETISYDHIPAAPPTATPSDLPKGSPGTVLSESDNLVEGEVTTTVDMARRAVVILSASFDTGWRVTVDGHPATPEMVVPAIVGVTVGPGVHTIFFRYQSFAWYPELIAVSLLTAGVGLVYERRRRQHAVSGAPGPTTPMT
jgi:hypothetical protein